MARELRVVITGDSAQLERALGKAQKKSSTFGTAIGKAAKVATVGLGALGLGIGLSVKAAQDAQVADAQMATQLKALGISYQANVGHINSVITAQSKLSALDDEDLQRSFTNIVRVTGNVNRALELNALAADIARARHISLETASKAVSKAAGGQAGALSRLGVVVKKGATGAEALAAAQKKYAGQAKTFGESAAGAQDRTRVSIENLQESIGKGLLPTVKAAADRMSGWADSMARHPGAVKLIAAAIAALAVLVIATNLAFKVYTASTQIWTAVTKAATAAQWLWNAALAANPITLVVVALAALAVGLVVAYKKSATFRAIVNGAFNAVKAVAGAVIGFITGHWKTLVALIPGIGPILFIVVNNFQTFRKLAKGAIDKVKAAIDAVRGAINTLKRVGGAALEVFSSAAQTALGPLKDLIDKIIAAIRWVAEHIPSLPGGSSGTINNRPGGRQGTGAGGGRGASRPTIGGGEAPVVVQHFQAMDPRVAFIEANRRFRTNHPHAAR